MSTQDAAPLRRYRTALIGLAIAVGLLILKQGVDLLAGSVSGVIASSVLYSLALAANFLALVAAACGVGRPRRAGIGYAICGWGYYFLALFEGPSSARVPPLITTAGFHLVLGRDSWGGGGGGGNPGDMIWAAHAAATVAAGLLGGWFAARLARPDGGLAPVSTLRNLARSLQPIFAERPTNPEPDPVHPLDRPG